MFSVLGTPSEVEWPQNSVVVWEAFIIRHYILHMTNQWPGHNIWLPTPACWAGKYTQPQVWQESCLRLRGCAAQCCRQEQS